MRYTTDTALRKEHTDFSKSQPPTIASQLWTCIFLNSHIKPFPSFPTRLPSPISTTPSNAGALLPMLPQPSHQHIFCPRTPNRYLFTLFHLISLSIPPLTPPKQRQDLSASPNKNLNWGSTSPSESNRSLLLVQPKRRCERPRRR